jgi:CheY-like chemotaxis protein
MTQGKKVLIVDDEPPIRVILTRWLKGLGVRRQRRRKRP